jgi:hypothetical protein
MKDLLLARGQLGNQMIFGMNRVNSLLQHYE